MTKLLQSQLRGARDTFLFVVEMNALHESQGSLDRIAQELRVASDDMSPGVRSRVRLGIVYAKRIHSRESSAELHAEVVSARTQAAQDDEVQVIARLAEAVIVLMRDQDFGGALSSLSALQDVLRYGSRGELYGLVRRWMAVAQTFLGRHADARASYEDALAAFRRYGMEFSYAATLNDAAVLRRRCGQYADAREMLLEALGYFDRIGARRNKILALNNLGIVHERLGSWTSAEKYYRSSSTMLATDGDGDGAFTPMHRMCTTNLEGLQVMRREFAVAEAALADMVVTEEALPSRIRSIVHELLGELYTEQRMYERARDHFDRAFVAMGASLSASDVMTEVLRRRAQLLLEVGELKNAREVLLKCIRLCSQIGDRYEAGAAQRVLGDVYCGLGEMKRADASFRAAVKVLKGIHDCYELMRTLYAQGKFFVSQKKLEDAEVALLEARQLARKLELDYYQALIAIAMMDTLGPQERFDEANSWLNEATSLRDNLEGIDRERVEAELRRAAEELQVAMTRTSVRSAEVLKTICRVYEDARFPIEELKPDLAYQVAQSVGGECLFVIGRHGGGFRVPLTYNIAVNEAKDLVRQMDKGPRKNPLLGVDGDPVVLRTPNDRTMVAVSCHHEDIDKRDSTQYILCTRFESVITVTPRQLEILCASAEALARLIEDEAERRGRPAGGGEEDTIRVKHPRGSFKDILTIDPEMIKVIKMSERAASSNTPILLEGETGVGKELFARAIHAASKRSEFQFVPVNAGGLSVHLLESELFGHVKGSFTGANGDRVGFIEMARGGTLFLDEIGEMSEELQVKLLRLLENGEYRRLGESVVRQADVRVISATNRDLKKEVDRGAFRRDLYYRVSPIKLTIPPLRLRARDIQLMVRYFLRDCAALNGIADRFIEIDVKAMEALELYDWPGNVRELHNEILRVVSLIGKGDLVRFAMLSDSIKDYLKTRNRGDGLLDRSVEQYERRLLLNALDKNDWNRMRTADAVGVPRTTLIAKLKRLNVASK